MKIWPVQGAKARLSEFLETCLKEGPQIVTKRGAKAAVRVPMPDWQRLRCPARPLLKDLLLSDALRGELDVPPRSRLRRRPPATLG